MIIKNLNEINTVSLTDLPLLWEQKSILILLIDLGSYNNFNTEHLDIFEKRYLETLKTSYFKKRYIISRLALKETIFSLFKEHFSFKNPALSEIHTYKDRHGKVHILYDRGYKNQTNSFDGMYGEKDPNNENYDKKDYKKFHVCISYTGNIISLALSKVELGIDIELMKPLSLQKLSGYLDPFKLKIQDIENRMNDNPSEDPFRSLITLTLKEAYCKFSNIDLLSNLNKNPDFNNLFYSVSILNDKYILSVVADKSLYANSQVYSQLISINYLNYLRT